jgi:hypothetical protein
MTPETQTQEHVTKMLTWSGVAFVALIAFAYIFSLTQ